MTAVVNLPHSCCFFPFQSFQLVVDLRVEPLPLVLKFWVWLLWLAPSSQVLPSATAAANPPTLLARPKTPPLSASKPPQPHGCAPGAGMKVPAGVNKLLGGWASPTPLAHQSPISGLAECQSVLTLSS